MSKTRIHDTDGFTLIELLVVIAVIGLLAALLGTFAIEVRVRSFEVKAVAQMQGLESCIHEFVAVHNGLPPACPVAVDPDAGGRYASAGKANYLNSAALHYWLGSGLRVEGGFDDTGKARIVKYAAPILEFGKSQVSTWDAMPEGGAAATDWPAGARVAGTGEVAQYGVAKGGILLDPWKRGIAYVVLAAGQGNHGAVKFPRTGKSFGASGRNLTGFCQMWSRGLDGVTALPDGGAATDAQIGSTADGDGDGRADNLDDISLWFLPYY